MDILFVSMENQQGSVQNIFSLSISNTFEVAAVRGVRSYTSLFAFQRGVTCNNEPRLGSNEGHRGYTLYSLTIQLLRRPQRNIVVGVKEKTNSGNMVEPWLRWKSLVNQEHLNPNINQNILKLETVIFPSQYLPLCTGWDNKTTKKATTKKIWKLKIGNIIKSCCVIRCANRFRRKTSGRSFYWLPTAEEKQYDYNRAV